MHRKFKALPILLSVILIGGYLGNSLSRSHATDASELEEQKPTSSHGHCIDKGYVLCKQTEIMPNLPSCHISKIVLYEYKNSDSTIFIYYDCDQKYDEDIVNSLAAYGKHCKLTNSYFSLSKDHLDKFLSVFYDKGLIADSSIDEIITHMNIPDFTMNSKRMIAILNQKINEETSSEDFKKIACAELEKIPFIKRRQRITWELIENLRESNPDKKLLTDLCELITIKDLPCYPQALIFKAELEFSEERKSSIEEHYRTPIIYLLEAPKDPTAKILLNSMVHHFYLNDNVGGNVLAELTNLDVSVGSKLRLIKLENKQKEENLTIINNMIHEGLSADLIEKITKQNESIMKNIHFYLNDKTEEEVSAESIFNLINFTRIQKKEEQKFFKNMIQEGLSSDLIMKVTGLKSPTVEHLKKEIELETVKKMLNEKSILNVVIRINEMKKYIINSIKQNLKKEAHIKLKLE